MPDTNGSGSSDRLDRIEGIIEALANRQQLIEDEHAFLLRSQVAMSDTLEKLATAQRRTEENMAALAEAQKHTDARMDALILTVDEIIRGRKREG